MGALLAIAVPLMMIVTAFRALVAAARRRGGQVLTPALLLVFMGALSSGLVFWWEDVVLTKPAASMAYGGELLPFIAADFLLWLVVWSALAIVTVRIARRLPEQKS